MVVQQVDHRGKVGMERIGPRGEIGSTGGGMMRVKARRMRVLSTGRDSAVSVVVPVRRPRRKLGKDKWDERCMAVMTLYIYYIHQVYALVYA